MTPEQEREIAVIMDLRRHYELKVIAERFHCSVKTLYRAWRRQRATGGDQK